jgi:lipopolysaccharide biosynthesis glycosyltransferase
MNKQISILLSADEHYARYCTVTILSVLSNTLFSKEIYFYILTPDFSSDSIQKIEELCQAFKAKVSFIPIDISLFQSFPTFHPHFNQNNYSRICGTDLCPNCDRLIYLDCDLVVLDDIAELFKSDLNDQPIGAIPHVQLPYQQTFVDNFPVNSTDVYFNSGVMLIDTDRWRREKYAEAMLNLACKYADKLHFADQDAFNALFWGNYHHLPGVWNVEARLYKEKLIGLPQTQEITDRMQNPKIIHYTGVDKPWSSKNYVPKRKIYLEYSDRLSSLTGWLPDSEVRCCHPLKLFLFIYSCIYFRLASFLKSLITPRDKF